MNSILTGISATFLIILLSYPGLYNSGELSGLVETEKSKTGSLKDNNRNIMRGTPMVLGKNLKSSVDFATDIKNWETLKNNGFNTIRVCWVDPWYKDHGKESWTVEEMLPRLDKVVENAVRSEMNLIINYHNVGPQQNFDTTFTFQLVKEFWQAVAPRYKDNELIYYELTNEPTFRMGDYLNPGFKENLMQIYRQVRKDAPEREILMFSFNTIQPEILKVVKHYEKDMDWDYTTVAYHMYNSTSSDAVKKLMQKHRVICTEWFYHFISLERPDYTFVKQVDGFKENAQTLEMIGSSWIDWRDWNDTTLNELLDTLITDAKLKNYWWK